MNTIIYTIRTIIYEIKHQKSEFNNTLIRIACGLALNTNPLNHLIVMRFFLGLSLIPGQVNVIVFG